MSLLMATVMCLFLLHTQVEISLMLISLHTLRLLVGIDQNGNIYVVFSIRSAIIDSLGNVTNVDDDNFLYTDIFIHKSEDGGILGLVQ